MCENDPNNDVRATRWELFINAPEQDLKRNAAIWQEAARRLGLGD